MLPPGDLPKPKIEPASLMSPALRTDASKYISVTQAKCSVQNSHLTLFSFEITGCSSQLQLARVQE